MKKLNWPMLTFPPVNLWIMPAAVEHVESKKQNTRVNNMNNLSIENQSKLYTLYHSYRMNADIPFNEFAQGYIREAEECDIPLSTVLDAALLSDKPVPFEDNPDIEIGLLSYVDLCKVVSRGYLTNVDPAHINAASIDVTLGNTLMVEGEPEAPIDLASKGTPGLVETLFDTFELEPNEFVLASTVQKFNLPNDISCEYKLKSSMARSGLDHLNAGWAESGFNDSVLTLEFKNLLQFTPLVLTAGMKCGQLIFFKHKPVPTDKSYSVMGQYNNSHTTTGSGGIR